MCALRPERPATASAVPLDVRTSFRSSCVVRSIPYRPSPLYYGSHYWLPPSCRLGGCLSALNRSSARASHLTPRTSGQTFPQVRRNNRHLARPADVGGVHLRARRVVPHGSQARRSLLLPRLPRTGRRARRVDWVKGARRASRSDGAATLDAAGAAWTMTRPRELITGRTSTTRRPSRNWVGFVAFQANCSSGRRGLRELGRLGIKCRSPSCAHCGSSGC